MPNTTLREGNYTTSPTLILPPPTRAWWWAGGALVVLATIGGFVLTASAPPAVVATGPAAPAPVALEEDDDATPLRVVVTDALRAGETLSEALSRHGVRAEQAAALVRDVKGALDVRALRPGAGYRIEGGAEGPATLAAFEMKTRSPTGIPRTVTATAKGAGFTVDVVDAPIETKVEALGGEVRANLYTAVVGDGGDANLVQQFVDVFAWDIDFYRQTQRGDSWKVVVEKHYAGGRFLGYGDVLAAEYVNAGQVHRGYRFKSKDGKVAGVFDDDGQALQKAFIKSPLEIARITSSYGQRFHPILKREKKHEGVDYGASAGTPFWAVADGMVKEARWSNSAGKMIVIKHINGYETEYFHCSRFADGLKPGMRVKQKQVIGYVGSTGRSTGPHLHFGMWKGGVRVDPQRQKFPNQKPVPKSHAGEYDRFVDPLLAMMKDLDVV